MFKETPAFSGFSVNDLSAAQKFYTEVLGLSGSADAMGMTLTLGSGNEIFVYEKADHQPATYTMLNFVVTDIDAAVTDLEKHGVVLERYDGAHQDDRGVARGKVANMGPDIAWFKDPAGNVLSVLEN